jgi:hypothetical protein
MSFVFPFLIALLCDAFNVTLLLLLQVIAHVDPDPDNEEGTNL